MRSPKSEAAQRVLDVCVEAKTRGEIDWPELNWVFGKAFEQFRADAYERAEKQLAAEKKRRGWWR